MWNVARDQKRRAQPAVVFNEEVRDRGDESSKTRIPGDP
jgi:hypothetical protein